MNIFQKFKEEKQYIALMSEYKDLYKLKRQLEINVANKICDYIESVTKTKAYKDRMLTKFRKHPDYMCYDLVLVSKIIQACNAKNYTLARDYRGDRTEYYTFSSIVIGIDDKDMQDFLDDYFEEGFEECSTCDMYSFFIDLRTERIVESCNYYSHNTCIDMIQETNEYVQDSIYEEVYTFNEDYERALRAYQQMLIELKDDIKEIFYEAKEEERIKLYY